LPALDAAAVVVEIGLQRLESALAEQFRQQPEYLPAKRLARVRILLRQIGQYRGRQAPNPFPRLRVLDIGRDSLLLRHAQIEPSRHRVGRNHDDLGRERVGQRCRRQLLPQAELQGFDAIRAQNG
jgi:hypothetical protein